MSGKNTNRDRRVKGRSSDGACQIMRLKNLENDECPSGRLLTYAVECSTCDFELSRSLQTRRSWDCEARLQCWPSHTLLIMPLSSSTSSPSQEPDLLSGRCTCVRFIHKAAKTAHQNLIRHCSHACCLDGSALGFRIPASQAGAAGASNCSTRSVQLSSASTIKSLASSPFQFQAEIQWWRVAADTS